MAYIFPKLGNRTRLCIDINIILGNPGREGDLLRLDRVTIEGSVNILKRSVTSLARFDFDIICTAIG